MKSVGDFNLNILIKDDFPKQDRNKVEINESYINNNTRWNCIDFSGPHAVIHHQHFQMVDLLTQHCRRSMNGLNACALPCVQPQCQEEINKMNGKQEEKDLKPNLAQPTPTDGQSKQGWKTHNNKKREEK